MKRVYTYNYTTQRQRSRWVIICLLTLLLPLTAKAQLPGGLGNLAGGSNTLPTAKPKEKGEKKVSPHPLFTGVTVGTDLFEPVAKQLLGQSYGGYSLGVEVGLYNRIFPTWEVGIGSAHKTPTTGNFTYTSHPSLYNRIGLNYNFSHMSLSKSFFYVGFRYGCSWFDYDITNISYDPPYWEQDLPPVDILNQQASAHWLEGLAGIRVALRDNLFMGWSVRYKYLFAQQNPHNSTPWYIPGYGTAGLPVGFTYTLSYRLPIPNSKKIIKQKPL